MRIIIAGAGEAGIYLAKNLSTENYDVMVIDSDPTRLESLDGYDLLTIEEDPLSTATLRNAGIDRANMFVALMPDDSENLLLSIMAKELGAQSTVARINRDSLYADDCAELLHSKGVDNLIYPEMLAVREVEAALCHPWSRHWSELCEGKLIVAAGVVNELSQLSNLALKDFARHASDFHVSAVTRGRNTVIPNGDTVLRNGDIAYISTMSGKESGISELFGCHDSMISKVMIVGGSRVGEMAARHISRKYDITLVEKDYRHAQHLSESMPGNVMVANGDGRSMEFLDSESISDYDAYLAFTESSEGNIIGCQIAREMGVGKTVVKTTSIDLVAEAEKLGINTVINKNLLCAGRIRQILLESCEENCMSLAGANIMVMKVSENAPISRKEIKEVNIPKGVTIAGMVRNGTAGMVMGNTKLMAGDKVVLFILPGTLNAIRKLF